MVIFFYNYIFLITTFGSCSESMIHIIWVIYSVWTKHLFRYRFQYQMKRLSKQVWTVSARMCPKCKNFRKYSIHDHVHLELDFLRAVEYVSTHPNANDEIMNLYDSPFAKNAVRYVYSIIRCVNTVFQATVCYDIIGAYVFWRKIDLTIF